MDKLNLIPAVQPANYPVQPTNQPVIPPATQSFEDLLKTQLGREPTVKFSAHAQRRITSREIGFGKEEATRLEEAVEKAANKGSRESLILMDDLALVVSIKNKMVITAVDANSRKENVFTNIDSVVLT
jgi:flagellar operon protein